MTVVRSGGREAHTAWRVARRFPRSARSLLEVRPETGRTHQIRVHLASVGLPIAGDPVYGRRGRDRAEPGLDRPALHARVLGLVHPASGERMRFEAELPADFAARLAALERREAAHDVIEHPLLHACGVRHGFGTRGDAPPAGLVRPRQVHGARVAQRRSECARRHRRRRGRSRAPARAGRAWSRPTACPCSPRARTARAVAAIHAGWRGLAAGVIEAGIDALRRAAPGQTLRAVIGPHIGPCCYEIDAPVLDALRYFDADLDAATTASRPGHHCLDLGALVAQRAGTRGRVAERDRRRPERLHLVRRAPLPFLPPRWAARGATRALDPCRNP